jgi:lysozyme
MPNLSGGLVVDLSHWQGTVDFSAIKSDGVWAVILKATQGISWVDVKFASNLIAALNAGLLVGAYHFCDNSSPALQAQHFLNIAGGLTVLALDTEKNSIPGGTVTVEQAAEIAARIHSVTNRLPLVYIGEYGPDGRDTGLPNSILSLCPLWLAQYRTTPTLPPGWSKWSLWQYTSNALVPGVITPCDRSQFNGSASFLQSWWENPLP